MEYTINISTFIKHPVKYYPEGTMIMDADNNHILDIRGWGRLQKLSDGEDVQDAIGRYIEDLINKDLELATGALDNGTNSAKKKIIECFFKRTFKVDEVSVIDPDNLEHFKINSAIELKDKRRGTFYYGQLKRK